MDMVLFLIRTHPIFFLSHKLNLWRWTQQKTGNENLMRNFRHEQIASMILFPINFLIKQNRVKKMIKKPTTETISCLDLRKPFQNIFMEMQIKIKIKLLKIFVVLNQNKIFKRPAINPMFQFYLLQVSGQ